MAAINGAGAGEKSAILTVSTKADYPGKPENLEITITRPDSFNIAWEDPINKNGEITGYSYQVTGQNAAGTDILSQVIKGGSKSRIDIPNLKPNTQYTVKLYAINAKLRFRISRLSHLLRSNHAKLASFAEFFESCKRESQKLQPW